MSLPNSPLIGLSFQRGPCDWTRRSLDPIRRLNFGVWDVPIWMFSERVILPSPTHQTVISDAFPYSVLNNVAEDGTEKMAQDLAANLESLAADLPKESVRALVLDFGLSSAPGSHEDPAVTERRFHLLRLLWAACTRQKIRLLLPLRIPAEIPEDIRWASHVIERAMCADLGFAVNIQVHEIRRIPDIAKLLAPLTFNIGLIRLCWNAGEGNTVAPEWFAPWMTWLQNAPVTAPLLFEPNHYTVQGFIDHAAKSALMAKLIAESIPQIYLD